MNKKRDMAHWLDYGRAMKPRILIDASTVTSVADGLSNYIISILRHLPPESFEEFDFHVLASPGVDRTDFTRLFEEMPLRPVWEHVAPIGPRRDLGFARFLWKYRGRFDLIHNTTTSFPLALRGGVGTIHDVTFKYMYNPSRNPLGLAVRYLDMVVRNAIRQSEALIAVSHSTKRELNRFFSPSPAQNERIHVVHEGWEHLVVNAADECCEDARPTQGNYLFSLGTARPHKNVPALLEAFALAIPHIPGEIQLILSGTVDRIVPELTPLIARINAERERVVFTGYLSHVCVDAYIRGADGFILPSLHEGFGISVLEAFCARTPLLCGNQSSLPEVAGDTAFFFDPNSTRAMADAIVQFYADRDAWLPMVERGTERLSQFSWKTAAAQTVDVYRDVLAARKR